jgi:hypothetical protein
VNDTLASFFEEKQGIQGQLATSEPVSTTHTHLPGINPRVFFFGNAKHNTVFVLFSELPYEHVLLTFSHLISGKATSVPTSSADIGCMLANEPSSVMHVLI